MKDPSKMPRGSSKKYRDKERREGGVEIQEREELDYSSDEEITIIHENRKQRAKRAANKVARRVKEEPKCRSVMFRYCLL